MSFAGTTFCALAITWARIGLPPTSCKTLGCFDLSRVPFPAAMIAMAIRRGCAFDGEDADLVFAALAMLSNISRMRSADESRVASQSTTNGLPVRRLRHERHQVMCYPVRSVSRHFAFVQIIAEQRADVESLDRLQI